MPRFSPQAVKSLIRLVRQSTTVPKTSKIRALTCERSDMLRPLIVVVPGRTARCEPAIHLPVLMLRHGLRAPSLRESRNDGALIKMEFVELAMFGLDV